MAQKERLKGLLAKIESVYKTDIVPVIGTDGIQIEENIWSEIEIGYLEENLRDDMAHAGMGRAGLAAPDGRYGHITVTVALKGSIVAIGAANLPELDVLLRMAGLEATLIEGTSVAYTPRSTGFESGTCYAYSSGSLYKLVGCRAQLTEISLVPSQIGRMTFEIWGVCVSAITDVTLPTIVYPQKAAMPPNVKSAAAALSGYTLADFSAWTMEMRTELATLPRGNDADGHGGYEIADWDPHIRVVLDKPALSAYNPYTIRQAGTLFAWTIGPIGSVDFNGCTIAGSKGRIVDMPHSAEDGLAMYDILIRCQNTDEETKDTAFSILFD